MRFGTFQKQDNSGELQTYRLMTSVSLPVYDRRENAVSLIFFNLFLFVVLFFVILLKLVPSNVNFLQNITEKIQINEAVWVTVIREVKIKR